jgi:hypothetical protein
MKTYFETIARHFPMPVPHYIAQVIKDALNNPATDPEKQIIGAGSIRFDLNEDGSYRSDKKTFTVQDRNGLFYEVTVCSLMGKQK